MRVAGSSTYLRERARRRATWSVVLAAAGVVCLVLAVLASQSEAIGSLVGGVLAFAGLGGVLLAATSRASARQDAAALTAEAPLLRQLEARLSDDYLLLRRVSLAAQAGEIDGVLLGPHGALVLHLFGDPGRFSVTRDDWTAAAGDDAPRSLRHSPTWSLSRRVRAVERVVAEEALPDLPVQGAVVLTQGELVAAERSSVAVVPLARIASFVELLPGPAGEDGARRESVELLGEVLGVRVAGAPRPAPASA